MNKAQSKVDEIYNFILSEIAQRHYQSGDRIIISQVAKACKTSEIPVREALRRIESEGYIQMTANKGATVIGITKDQLRNIAEISGVLEGYATRCAVDYLSPAAIRDLRRINEEMYQAYIVHDDQNYAELNHRFHKSLFSVVPNTTIQEMIEQLWQRWIYTAGAFSMVPRRLPTSYKEHLEILDLIEQKKFDEAETLARNHKIHFLNTWIEEIPDSKEH